MKKEIKKEAQTIFEAAKSLLLLLWNKGVAIAALFVFGLSFLRSNGGPLIEVTYTLAVLSLILVSAPVVRLIMFRESATYAESGDVDEDLKTMKYPTPRLIHYWFATAISYLVTILCATPLLKF